MKERAILFSAPMVRALLAGTKTQTRRGPRGGTWGPQEPNNGHPLIFDAKVGKWVRFAACDCPYGQPGDRLWVRETYFAFGRWETRFSAKKGRDEWHFVDMTVETGRAYQFVPPAEYVKAAHNRGSVTPTWWKRPAIFMPRRASRITLEATGVRVERLQDISEADAIAEGVHRSPGCRQDDAAATFNRIGPVDNDSFPIARYAVLWESINGAGSWDANPWVWVIDFRRLP